MQSTSVTLPINVPWITSRSRRWPRASSPSRSTPFPAWMPSRPRYLVRDERFSTSLIPATMRLAQGWVPLRSRIRWLANVISAYGQNRRRYGP